MCVLVESDSRPDFFITQGERKKIEQEVNPNFRIRTISPQGGQGGLSGGDVKI